MIPEIKIRALQQDPSQLEKQLALSKLQARIIASRCPSVEAVEQVVNPSLHFIPRPDLLKDSVNAAKRIVRAIVQQETIGILTDYDVDGITSHAIVFFALSDYFKVPEDRLVHLIGHRIDDGYGVSQGLIDKILGAEKLPSLIITADCGSSDENRISQLKANQIDVIVTDHHAIPQEGTPQSAYATVNPTQEDCDYPDNTIAGCMVSWLLMCQVRTELIAMGILEPQSAKLAKLLDFVSLGTIADAVSLYSPVNRAVVKTGLSLINQVSRPCWAAIQTMLNKEFLPFTTEDLGFQIGPRINARSRMSDPYRAFYYLSARSQQQAFDNLKKLDEDNQVRKQTEKEMLDIALKQAFRQLKTSQYSLVVFDQRFHPGVQGIVASRLIERFGRPVIVFSPMNDPDMLTGSARTINSVHIRQAIERVANQSKDIVISFGGHKGAAGLKINKNSMAAFTDLFEQAIAAQVGFDTELRPIIWTDGELLEEQMTFETIAELKRLEPFGREFETAIFEGDFLVQNTRIIGNDGTHLMMQLATENHTFRAIWFRALGNKNDKLPFVEGQFIKAAYQLRENYYKGQFSLQLNIIHARL